MYITVTLLLLDKYPILYNITLLGTFNLTINSGSILYSTMITPHSTVIGH